MFLRPVRLYLFVAFFFLFPALLFPASVPPSQLVSQAMDDVLLEMGNPFLKVIKQGSWISGDKYRNPLTNLIDPSDHDARLFISLDDVSPERAREVWKAYQGRLRKKIFAMAQKAGYSTDQIQLLLKSVNFYPPAQLLKGIEQNEQAIARFLKMGNYPNLLEVGEEAAEGLYTTPAKFIRQGYEKGARVQVVELVADEGSDTYRLVQKATAEAEHAAEVVGEANLKGYVQSAEYSLNEAQKALKDGKLDTAKKNLSRAKDRMKSARKLGGVSSEGAAVKELDALEKQIDDAIELAFKSSDEAKAIIGKTREIANRLGNDVMKKANVDLAALETMAAKNSIKQRAFLKGVLEGEGKWATLRVNLEEASGSASLNTEERRPGRLQELVPVAYGPVGAQGVPRRHRKRGCGEGERQTGCHNRGTCKPHLRLRTALQRDIHDHRGTPGRLDQLVRVRGGRRPAGLYGPHRGHLYGARQGAEHRGEGMRAGPG